MEHYGDLLDDDGQSPDVFSEITALAFDAGRGAAALEAQQANSSEHWGDRIVDAADKMRSRDLWDPIEDGEQ